MIPHGGRGCRPSGAYPAHRFVLAQAAKRPSDAAFELPAESVGPEHRAATGLRGETGPQGPKSDSGPLGRIAIASDETLVGGFTFSTLKTVTITAPAQGFVRLDGLVQAFEGQVD